MAKIQLAQARADTKSTAFRTHRPRAQAPHAFSLQDPTAFSLGAALAWAAMACGLALAGVC